MFCSQFTGYKRLRTPGLSYHYVIFIFYTHPWAVTDTESPQRLISSIYSRLFYSFIPWHPADTMIVLLVACLCLHGECMIYFKLCLGLHLLHIKNIWFFCCCSGQHIWGLSLIVLQLYGQIHHSAAAILTIQITRTQSCNSTWEVTQRSKEHVLLQNLPHCEETLGFWQWHHFLFMKNALHGIWA